MFVVTAYSFWVKPEKFECETLEEAKALCRELKDHQYGAEIEEIS